MRIALLLVLLAATAAADTPKSPPAPDLVLRWTEGEMSRDMSIWRTTITVTGTKLHYSRAYSGRMPMGKPVELDATVKDPKKVAAALEALDKIKVKPPAKSNGDSGVHQIKEACVMRGKNERCASVSPPSPDTDELKAMAAIRDAVLDGVKVSPLTP